MLSRQRILANFLGSLHKRALHGSGIAKQNPFQHLKRLTGNDSEVLRSRFAAVVGDNNVSLAEAVRTQHGQDEGPDNGVDPDVVVFPQDTEQVSEVSN